MKKYLLVTLLSCFLFSCSTEQSDAVNTVDEEISSDMGSEEENSEDIDTTEEENSTTPNLETNFTDSFDIDGALIDYVTNNESAVPAIQSLSGRYHAILNNNAGNITLHFNNSQGRIDAKLVEFPFEFIARNIGIGTVEDSQVAPFPTNSPYIFSGIQVHIKDFNSINSSHVVIGHRGGTGYTIEGKNTVNGSSSVNDIGQNTVPDGRADLKIVGNADKSLVVYWQTPNLDYENTADSWNLYRNTGNLPGATPAYDDEVYIGLITYAYGQQGVPFVGTCDEIQITDLIEQ